MLDYLNNIQDHLVARAFRKLIDAINDNEQATKTTAAKVDAIQVPTLAEIQQALQLGGPNTINVTGLLGTLAQSQIAAIPGNHAQRLATPPSNGAFFWETDRTSLYVGVTAGATTTWRFVGGTMQALIASRPVDLGTGDVGFRFVDSTADQNAEYVWTGTEFVTVDYLQEVTDAVTNALTIIMVISHLSTVGTGVGFGSTIPFQLSNSVPATKLAGFLDILWDVATAGNEGARFIFRAMRGGTAAASILEFNKALCIISGTVFWLNNSAFSGQLFHANSANRVYTFDDADGNIVYETAALTNNNFVFGAGGQKVKDAGFGAGISGSVTLAALTGGGTTGSITYVNGLITAVVAPT